MATDASALALVVAHHDSREPRDHKTDSFLMRRVRQIRVASGGVFKEHHKAVREAFAQTFRARIHAPRQPEDAGNFTRKVFHDAPHVGDVGGRAGVFELEKGDVFDAFHPGSIALGGGDREARATHILPTFFHIGKMPS